MPERINRTLEKYNWYYDVSGRRVDFVNGSQLSWGIEIKIPLDLKEKRYLKEVLTVALPEQIKYLRFLDLSPQESLPEEQRTIEMTLKKDAKTALDLMFAGIAKRREEIGGLFWVIFGDRFNEIKRFNSLLSMSQGSEILFVTGHSSDDPWKIGEQTDDFVGKRHSEKWGPFVQRVRNAVPVKTVLSNYNDPSTYAAILIVSCYTGKKGPMPIDVPVIYVNGTVYGEFSSDRPPVKIVVPGKK